MKEKVNTDLRDAYSEVPQSFHRCVRRTLNGLEERRSAPRRSAARVALVCALVLSVCAVGALSASAIYPLVVDKNSEYEIGITLEPSDTQLSEYVKLNLGWLPDGVTESNGKYSLNGESQEKCFTFEVYMVDEKTELTYGSVTEYENLTVNGNDAVIAYRELTNGGPSRIFYVYFEDEGAFVQCYVSDDVTDAEMRGVMENMTVTAGTETDYTYVSYTSEITGTTLDSIIDTAAQLLDISAYSETFYEAELGTEIGVDEKYLEEHETGYMCSYSVDSIEILSNVSALDSDCFGALACYDSISEITDEDGNLLPYTRTTYKYGDGVNTLDEVYAVDDVNRILVYATVTVNNTSDSDQEFNLWSLGLSRLSRSDGSLMVVGADGEPVPDDPWYGEITYIDNNDADEVGFQSGYYILTVPAGSSETVHIGFLADEDTADQLYVTAGSTDSCSAFDVSTNKFTSTASLTSDEHSYVAFKAN